LINWLKLALALLTVAVLTNTFLIVHFG